MTVIRRINCAKFETIQDFYAVIAKKLSFEGIGRILAALVKLNDRLKANVNTELSFESFAGAIRDEIQKEI